MTTLATLKRQARKSAAWHGHTMGRFTTSRHGNSFTECLVCGAIVTVDTHPPPNGTDVMGRAVAVGCPMPQDGIDMEDRRDMFRPTITIWYADATIRDASGHVIAWRKQVITPDIHQLVLTEYPDVQPYGYTVFTGISDARAHIRASNGAHFLEV